MAYNIPTFLLLNGSAPELDRQVPVRTLQVGDLTVLTGAICASDPFMYLNSASRFAAPNGQHPVFVTVADVSERGDGSHRREAYLSVMFNKLPIARVDTALEIGGVPLQPDQAYGVPVDAAVVSFADASAVHFAPEDGWDSLADTWFSAMDSASHYFEGVANLPLPGTSPEVNIVLCHSGWGDGFYPVIASYDANDDINGLHIDLQVLGAD